MDIPWFERPGPRPVTDGPVPHRQVTQTAPRTLQDRLYEELVQLPGVYGGPSHVSVPGARALHLHESDAAGPPEAFQARTEFAHIHPLTDGSMHICLPERVRTQAVELGWAEPHPTFGTLMVYGPRDDKEYAVARALLQASYAFAKGEIRPGATSDSRTTSHDERSTSS